MAKTAPREQIVAKSVEAEPSPVLKSLKALGKN
jgi:hypothetical protein